MNLLDRLMPEIGGLTFERVDDNNVAVTRRSVFSGEVRTMILPVTTQQQDDYINNRGPIQNIMPNLTCDQREFILSGATPEEWDANVPEEDE
jgi:hypothetical protein